MGKELKILFAPSNIASVPDIMIQAFNKLPDVHARGLSLFKHRYWTFSDNWTVIDDSFSIKSKPHKKIASFFKKNLFLFRSILWADVIFWTWDIIDLSFLDFHYRLLKLLKKPVYVEWVGSDIRVPEWGFAMNEFYKRCWDSGEYDYYDESKEKSYAVQKRFYNLNAVPLEGPEMSLYLFKELFPSHYFLYQQRIDPFAFDTKFPDQENQVPTIVHTPSAHGAKGSKYVRQAIEKLQQRNIPLNYVEISNKTRQESLNAIGDADIFIDQLIWGNYGVAATEAMAMGKPTVCYLVPKVVERLPSECPIINATCDNLADILEPFLKDASLRYSVGVKSRKFAEEHHDVNKMVVELKKHIESRLGH